MASEAEQKDEPEVHTDEDAPSEKKETSNARPASHSAPSSPYKRAAFVLLFLFLFWASYKLRTAPKQAKVIHASRYSKEYKFRPAASPIITETLKDGRTRLRGALAEPTLAPPPPSTPPKRKNSSNKKRRKKAGGSAKKR